MAATIRTVMTVVSDPGPDGPLPETRARAPGGSIGPEPWCGSLSGGARTERREEVVAEPVHRHHPGVADGLQAGGPPPARDPLEHRGVVRDQRDRDVVRDPRAADVGVGL